MKDTKDYKVDSVVCDYGVFYKGELVDGLILNSRTNALLIADILNADDEHRTIEKYDEENGAKFS